MANVYVRSGAAGAGTGADWANAYTTLAAALTAKAAGDDFWVSEDHAETQGSAMALSAPATLSAGNRIICVNHAGSVPPVSADLATTATITTTGNFAITIGGSFAGPLYFYGIIFSSGSGANSVNLGLCNGGNSQYYKNCALRLGGTTGGTILLSNANGRCILDNTTVQFASTASGIIPRGKALWKNTASAITGATIPTTLFASTNAQLFEAEAVDLSAMSGGTLIPNIGSSAYISMVFRDCKLPASVTILAAQVGSSPSMFEAAIIRCDSGATNYRQEKHMSQASMVTETTIVRTGGATDGTTPIAWKITTNANNFWWEPFVSLPMTIWNDVVGSSITVTVYGIWGGGAVPNNDDIWLEGEYLGSTLTPQGSISEGSKSDALATATALSTDSSTWGGSTTKFKMTLTFTPQMKGPINITIKAAKASSTFYIDPKPSITGISVSKSAILAPGVYANERANPAMLVNHEALVG